MRLEGKPGTVRLSPACVVANLTNSSGYNRWALSLPISPAGSFWAMDEFVKDWPVIHKPVDPVGTMKYRKFESTKSFDPFADDDEDDNLFEVAVKTKKGWLWINQRGAYEGPEPVDNDNGKWTTVNVLG